MAEAINVVFMLTKENVDTMVEYIDVALKVINSEVKTALIS
jgi:uncharacterized protein YfkK (UPF0435 family)